MKMFVPLFVGLYSNPSSPPQAPLKPEIMDLVRLKRSPRRRYLRSQDPVDKSAYRRAEDDLKKLFYETKGKYFDEMLLNADPTKTYGFKLWKCTRNMKRQPLRKISTKKSDSEISLAFADELEKRFQPFELASRP